jgi:hypothetical protein
MKCINNYKWMADHNIKIYFISFLRIKKNIIGNQQYYYQHWLVETTLMNSSWFGKNSPDMPQVIPVNLFFMEVL